MRESRRIESALSFGTPFSFLLFLLFLLLMSSGCGEEPSGPPVVPPKTPPSVLSPSAPGYTPRWVMMVNASPDEEGNWRLRWADAVWRLGGDGAPARPEESGPEPGTRFLLYWKTRPLAIFSYSGDPRSPAPEFTLSPDEFHGEKLAAFVCLSLDKDQALPEMGWKWTLTESLTAETVLADFTGDGAMELAGSVSYRNEQDKTIFGLYLISRSIDQPKAMRWEEAPGFFVEKIVAAVDLDGDQAAELVTQWEDGHRLEYRLYEIQKGEWSRLR